MANYTTQVRHICESMAGKRASVGRKSVDAVLASAAPKVFDFDWPVFDEEYRLPLETKILRHYYTREIGEETFGLWQLRLEARMNEIMPYYNQLYESQLKMIGYDPFQDVDLTTDHRRGVDGSTSQSGKTSEKLGGKDERTLTLGTKVSNSGTDETTKSSTFTPGATVETKAMGGVKTTSSDWTLYSDTPQGAISRVDLSNNAYLTNATKVEHTETPDSNTGTTTTVTGKGGKDSTDGSDKLKHGHVVDTTGTEVTEDAYGRTAEGSSSSSGTSKTTEDYLQHVKGKTAGKSYAYLLREWRETFLNIDAMVIEELSDLFMMLWE